MKKITIFIFIILAVLLSVVGCGNQEKKQDIRKLAWAELSKNQLNEVRGSWEDAEVSVIKKPKTSFFPSRHDDKEVYLVSFPVKRTATHGNILAYVSKDKKKFIGFGLRD